MAAAVGPVARAHALALSFRRLEKLCIIDRWVPRRSSCERHLHQHASARQTIGIACATNAGSRVSAIPSRAIHLASRHHPRFELQSF